ncbi:MAG: DNA-binding transcriptional LysR family regulator [Myxococcota bacterium]|jgi:DNA-binding transcriptional LysR family regulator
MKDDLNQLRVFVEVVRQGGFSAAARALDMPRSTVSRWVQELEKRLGVRLLQRTTRSVQLTEIGEGYYQRGLQAVELAEQAHTWVQSHAEAPQGTLRVATFQLFAATLLGPVVVAYLEQNPGMSVQVVISERNINLVDEHIDLAIRIGALPDSSLVVRKLAHMEGWMLASPAYLARHGAPAHPSELTRHSNMIYGHSEDTATLPFDNGHEQLDVSLPGRCVANSIELVRQVTLGGMVIGFLPPLLAHEDLAAGRLVRVLTEWNIGSLPMYVAYPSRSHLAQKVRAFVDLLATQITSDAVHGQAPLQR